MNTYSFGAEQTFWIGAGVYILTMAYVISGTGEINLGMYDFHTDTFYELAEHLESPISLRNTITRIIKVDTTAHIGAHVIGNYSNFGASFKVINLY